MIHDGCPHVRYVDNATPEFAKDPKDDTFRRQEAVDSMDCVSAIHQEQVLGGLDKIGTTQEERYLRCE